MKWTEFAFSVTVAAVDVFGRHDPSPRPVAFVEMEYREPDGMLVDGLGGIDLTGLTEEAAFGLSVGDEYVVTFRRVTK